MIELSRPAQFQIRIFMSRNRSPIFLSWPTLFFVGVASLTTHGKLLAAPQPAKTDIASLAPEKCELAVAWFAEIKPDLNGADLERWLAQPEMMDGFEELKKLYQKNITDSVARSEPADAALTKLMSLQIGLLATHHPWIFYFEELDPKMEFPPFRFALELRDAEAELAKKLEEFKKVLGDDGKTISVGDTEFLSYSTNANSPPFEFGIYQGHFIASMGEDSLESLIKNFSTPAPAWVDDLKNELPIDRLAGLFRVDLTKLMKLANESDEVPPELHLEEMQEVIGALGLEKGETVTRVALHCPPELRGVLKSFEVEPLKIAELGGIPDSIQSAFAIHFSPKRIWEILTTNKDSAPNVAEFTKELKDNLGIDFEKDAIESFDDFVYAFQSINMLNPAAGFAIVVRVRNPENFSVRLTEILEEVNDNDQMEFTIETAETNNGTLYRLVPKDVDPDFGIGICFLLDDNELVIAEEKALNSHMRKKRRAGGKLTDDVRVAGLFDDKQNGKLGEPIAFYYLDIKSIVEVVYSIVPMLMGGFPAEDGEVTGPLDSLPPLEVVTNGLNAEVVGFYRTQKGFEMVERATVPNPVMISAFSGMFFVIRDSPRAMAPEMVAPEIDGIEAEEFDSQPIDPEEFEDREFVPPTIENSKRIEEQE